MVVFLLFAILLAGVAAALIARGYALSRTRATETLGHIEAYGFEGTPPTEADRARGPLSAALDRVAQLVGGTVVGRLKSFREDQIRKELFAAGMYRTSPIKFMGYRVLFAVGLPVLWIWIMSSTDLSAAIKIFGLVWVLAVAWKGPILMVRARARRRLGEIDHQLPELIDLLVVTVEAGLSFTGSLQVAADRLKGPLGDELRLTIQEQTFGLSTNEALRNMLDRCETPGTRSFVRSVLQGETLGVSIGQVMRNLAAEMRKRRKAAAEERAHKAPVKILFPLVFLIFPAMFVVLLGPAVFTFLEVFGD